MKNYFLIIILLFGVINVYSQSVSNNLYLVIDQKNDTILRENPKSNTKIEYYQINKKKNWNLSLRHIYSPNYVKNNYRYQLPSVMVEQLMNNGNVTDIKTFLKKFDKLSYKKLSQYLSIHYSYYYEYLDGHLKKTYKRYNIFLIFKSDLKKKYVPCYEVSLILSRMVEM
jgi:hypothetical protein